MTTPKAGTEGGAANGGANGGGEGGAGPLTSEAVSQFMRGFKRPEDAVEKLLRDNRKYRRRFRGDSSVQIDGRAALEEDIRDLEAENQRLAANVIPAGHVAVTTADATALVEYKKLGDIKKLTETIAKKTELEAKLAEREDADRMASAAEKVGFKPKVLTKLAQSEKFVVEERDVEVTAEDGTKSTKKMPYARVAADDKAEWLPLDKFAEKNLSDFLPSLRSAEGTTEGAAGHGSATGNGQRGVTLPRQTASTGSAPSTDVVGIHSQQRYQRPSERNKKAQ